MPVENRCPTCGAILPEGSKCPFCTEALRLVQHLASAEEVRLCRRCGGILQEGDEGDLCANCRLQAMARPPVWRREDRIARWLREHVVEPPVEEAGRQCPQCGKTIPMQSLFCLYCGKPVASAETPEESPSGPMEVPASGTNGFPEEREFGVSPQEGKRASVQAEGTTPGRPPLSRRVWAFWQGQFGPLRKRAPGPSPRVASGSLGKETDTFPIWLWVLLGLLLLGLAGMALFWTTLLTSGGIAFR